MIDSPKLPGTPSIRASRWVANLLEGRSLLAVVGTALPWVRVDWHVLISIDGHRIGPGAAFANLDEDVAGKLDVTAASTESEPELGVPTNHVAQVLEFPDRARRTLKQRKAPQPWTD